MKVDSLPKVDKAVSVAVKILGDAGGWAMLVVDGDDVNAINRRNGAVSDAIGPEDNNDTMVATVAGTVADAAEDFVAIVGNRKENGGGRRKRKHGGGRRMRQQRRKLGLD
jgi:hypothetical protein